MSSTLYIQSFISKLDKSKDTLELRQEGFKVNKIFNYLSSKLKDSLSEYKIKTLAILLQHQYVEGFTMDELVSVGSLRIDLFSHNTNETIRPAICANSYLYDTGSGKVYDDLYSKGLSSYQVNYLISSNKRSLTKFVIDCLSL
jgi:hypothetical protein